jgi:GDP-L-fucose synthase
MADACIYLMEQRNFADTYAPGTKGIRNSHINIGTGEDISTADLAELVRRIVSFSGRLVFDETKPDGTFRKLTDVSKLHGLGWRHKVVLEDGVARIYEWYRNHAQATASDFR